MKIAVTYENENVFQHFGHTESFKFYEVDGSSVKSSEIVSSNGQGHGALSEFLKNNGVDVLICGGIGAGAREALSESGIKLYPGVIGNADSVVEDLLNDRLQFNPDTMCNHHHGEHSCGGHSHGHGCSADKHGCSGNH